MDKRQIINILQEAAILYEKNLANKKILIVYEMNNKVQTIEVLFKRNNFLHLTGVQIINKNLNPNIFYQKILNQRLSLHDFSTKKNGTTELKIRILNQISSLNKFVNMIGNYDAQRKFLMADKVIGNTNVCLCLKNIANLKYVPISAIKEDIKNITSKQYRIICIATKNIQDKEYNEISYMSKNNERYKTLEKINILAQSID